MNRQRIFETRSKADFRVLREILGLTQLEIAQAFGVTVLSVKNWESTSEFYPPRRDVWQWIEDLYTQADYRASEQVALGKQAFDTALADGKKPHPVLLTWWRTKAQWQHEHPGQEEWEYHLDHAVSRMTAERLHALGIPVSMQYAQLAV